MPFNIGQLFVRNPYENDVDPSTGLYKRPNIWQNIAWQPESDAVLRQNYEQKQFQNTDQPLTRNPAYMAPGFAGSVDQGPPTVAQQQGASQYGVTNPYVRPSAMTSYWHPETLRTWQQFENAPYEQEAARQAYIGMTPAVVGREDALGAARFSREQDEFRPREQMRIEQLKNTEKTLTDIHHNQAVTTVTLARRMGLIDKLGPQYSHLSDDDLATLAKNDPSLNGLLNTVAVGNQITAGLPKIEADLQAARSKLAQAEAEEEIKNVKIKHGMLGSQYESEGRRLSEANKLGLPEAQARQQNFEALTGVPLGASLHTPYLPNISSGALVGNPNTQYNSPYALEMQAKMDFAKNFQNNSRSSALGSVGITPATRPAMGFTSDNFNVTSSLPPSLQQSLVAIPRPTLAQQITGMWDKAEQSVPSNWESFYNPLISQINTGTSAGVAYNAKQRLDKMIVDELSKEFRLPEQFIGSSNVRRSKAAVLQDMLNDPSKSQEIEEQFNKLPPSAIERIRKRAQEMIPNITR